MNLFAWTKYLYTAIQVESGWPLDMPERMWLHKKLKNLFYIHQQIIGCAICGKELKKADATIEHIIPKSKGGTYKANNLTITCWQCNNKRGNKDFEDYYNSKQATNRRQKRNTSITLLGQ